MALDVDSYYRKYGAMVNRRCRALLKDDEMAMDAMQDVFVELVRRREHLEIDSPSAFLYRSATNICLNRIRSQKRKPLTPDTDLLERIAIAPIAEERTIARSLLSLIFAEEKDSTREMAVSHLLDGMTLQEVADEFGLSVSGVRKRLRTLRARIPELEGVFQ